MHFETHLAHDRKEYPMTLKVTTHDNRGEPEYPYGFVYFNDDKRIGYVPSIEGMKGPYGLFEGGGWGPISPFHYTLAEAYLTDVFPFIAQRTNV